MRYIRTEDGIFEVKKVEILCGVKFYDYETREDFVNRIREEQIISQADTIEELCDEVVLIDEKHKKPKWLLDKPKDIANFIANFNELPTAYKNRINKGTFMLKFGIWTEKGLIYVAKINSDGKLVLI